MLKKYRSQSLLFAALLLASVLTSNLAFLGEANAVTRNIIFPVIGPSYYSNDYNAPRGDELHHAIDIIADKRRPLVAAVAGTIIDVQYPQPSWGYSVTIRDDAGYTYRYIHINDDNPGTNDGRGGGMQAYAPDVREGNRVGRGQLIGRVGDSGRSNGVPHLHFEMFLPNGQVTTPYNSLRAANRMSKPAIDYPTQPGEIIPYGRTFRGSANVALGNFDGDNGVELVTTPNTRGGPHGRLFNHDNNRMGNGFYAFSKTFKGGLDVAAGDIDDSTPVDEIVVAPRADGAPRVRVFRTDGTQIGNFLAYGEGFRGGVRVAAGDVDGDGEDEIITGPNTSGGPHVKVFELDGTLVTDFFAYGMSFRGGIDVTSADVSGGPEDEIITAAGPGGGPHVKVFNMSGNQLSDFYAYNINFKSGVRVSAGNTSTNTSKSEILTVPNARGGPSLKTFNGSGSNLDSEHFLEEWWIGSYDVAAGEDKIKIGTGINRRTAVKPEP